MESLWARQTFSAGDLRRFVTGQSKPDRVEGARIHAYGSQHNGNDWLRHQDVKTLSFEDLRTGGGSEGWQPWVAEINAKGSQENVFALAISQRAMPGNEAETIYDHPALLKYVPMKRENFKKVVEDLHIHPAISVLVNLGTPTISRIKTDSSDRQVYTLRIEQSLTHQTAMTVTYFPGKAGSTTGTAANPHRIHAIILGYDEDDTKELRKRLKKCKAAIFSPFTLVKAFLHVEKRRRFDEVNNKITAFQTILQNYGRVPIGNEASLDRNNSRSGNANSPLARMKQAWTKSLMSSSARSGVGGGADDPKNLIRLYLDVCALKNALAAWNAQLRSLREDVGNDEFGAEAAADVEPREYLRRLAEEYDVKIDKCDTVLQGASLAFQMETAHLSRLDTQIALRDGKQMKAVALLTMIFLPATFIATLLAVPHFKDTMETKVFSPWLWYLILSLPLTAVVLAIYFTWINCYKTSTLEDSFKMA
ncbi:protein kinase [Colletotrichum musicola]|uniref:Protein kinase n=1 Tax=Colletotrichum musicola TaxID=2175873 RepID=A0A8H6N6Z4_9PEZI|nr:protein kinase [Colletotrichum musicola]